MTDIEIARNVELKKITEIAKDLDITEEEILGQCINTSDIKSLIKDIVDEKFKSDNMGINPNKVNDNIRGVMVEKLNEAYEAVMASAENVNLQQMNDYLAQNFQHTFFQLYLHQLY